MQTLTQKEQIMDKDPMDMTIGEKIKRVSLDETFTWEHVYDILVIKLTNWVDLLLLKLPNLIIGLIVFFLFTLFAKYGGRLFYKILKRTVKQESVRYIIIKTFKGLTWLTGFLVFLIILDLGVIMTSVLGLAGVASLTFGLALQGALNNTFSGVILSFLPRLEIGDWVETNDLQGTVTEISLRSVQILREDNNYVMVPNTQILESPFTNYSLTPRIRVSVNCGVHYKSDLRRVKELAVEHFEQVFPQFEEEGVDFFYTAFNDSSIDFKIRFWGNARSKAEELAIRDMAIIELKELFDKHGITIPFPIRTIEIEGSSHVAV
jgi:small conductance mechanosensitive channel